MKLLKIAVALTLCGAAWANCGNDKEVGNGCTVTQGSAGPQGANGQKGDRGESGVNGRDGKDGTVPADLHDANAVVDVAVRLYDGKHFQIQAFNAYALGLRPSQDVFGNGRNLMYGVRLVLKIGRSYEERRLDAQAKEIELLKRALGI